MYKCILIVTLSCLMVACSESDKPQKVEQDHVWKGQTDMIDKAKNVEKMMQDAAALQQQKIDQQTR